MSIAKDLLKLIEGKYFHFSESSSFNKWLDTFIEEKGIDLDDEFTVESPDGTPNYMSYGVVIDHMKIAPESEQKALKDVIVKLDFKNASITDFLKHLAQALAKNL